MSKRAVAISPLRLRLPKLIFRHPDGRAQDPFRYVIGRLHSFDFQECVNSRSK